MDFIFEISTPILQGNIPLASDNKYHILHYYCHEIIFPYKRQTNYKHLSS